MISIIIPCYNHNDIVLKAVTSAIKQQAEREIIVVDDGSTVPLQNIWGNHVRVLRHEKNRGLSHALNTGIAHSNGDRFLILAADDQIAGGYLKHASQFDADIVSCDMLVGGRPVRSKPGSLRDLMNHNCHSYCAIVKKWFWEETGGFNPYMNPSQEDWEFFLHCAKLGATWHHVSKPFHMYNRNPTGRDALAQGKDRLLDGKRQGFHQDLFGKGIGLVTVIIPCYDQEQYLKDSIPSALDQIYPHVNVVVVDDGSPGNVVSAVRDLDIDHSRVAIIKQKNRHLSGARNSGIAYALERYNSQYIVPVDADDEIHPEFIEKTMGGMQDNCYVYSDVQFIGDAWHVYTLDPFNCKVMAKKHQHACTILMQSKMLKTIKEQRGFYYDETMKEGYEDWEFALAAIEGGWCGSHFPEPLFHYRNHANGSMRTEAADINDKLARIVARKHPWIRGGIMPPGCRSCGSNKYTRRVITSERSSIMMVHVPGIGEMDAREPIEVTYMGTTRSQATKIGGGGKIYKYCGKNDDENPTHGRKFTAFVRDAHLFAGPFKIERVNLEPNNMIVEQVVPPPKPMPVQHHPAVGQVEVVPEDVRKFQAKIAKKRVLEVEALDDEDDFIKLKYIGKATAKKLYDNGFTYYEDVADAPTNELMALLGFGANKVDEIKASAEEILSRLE